MSSGCVTEGYLAAKVRRWSFERRHVVWQALILKSYRYWWDINLWKFTVSAHSSHIYTPGLRLWHWHIQAGGRAKDTSAAANSSFPTEQVEDTICPTGTDEAPGDNRESLVNWKQVLLAVGVTSLPSTPLSVLSPLLTIALNMWLRLWPITVSHSSYHSHWSREMQMTPNWANQNASLGFFYLELEGSPSSLLGHKAGPWEDEDHLQRDTHGEKSTPKPWVSGFSHLRGQRHPHHLRVCGVSHHLRCTPSFCITYTDWVSAL